MIRSRAGFASVIALLTSLSATASPGAAARPADLVLTHGAIYTQDAKHPWVEAVAIEAGKFSYAGSAAGAKAYIGPSTQVVDLHGKYAQPGIVDEHVHPIMGGIKVLYECNFPFTATPEAIASAVAACAARTPAGTWIRGGQWGSSFFQQYTDKVGSPRAFLDAVAGGHPVFLNDDSGHNGWVNSAALKIAGLDAQTRNPDGGTIVRGADGEPNGVMLETAARIFDTVIPVWTNEQFIAAAKESSRLANSYGITSIKDAGAPFHPTGLAFSELDKAGGLTLNVALCLPTPYGKRDTPLDYDSLDVARKQFRTAHVHTEFVKIFLDGVPTPARTAAMLAPYVADEAHGAKFAGEVHVNRAVLARDLIELDKRGYTVKMHAAGDGAIRVGLDVIEAARKANGMSGLHHELAHAGFIGAVDIPRFARLDAIPDYSPIIWHPSPIIEAVIAAVGERGKHYWPTRSLLDSGARIAAGSDWPAAVPDQNPWVGVEALVTRKDPRGQTPGALWPEQAVTLKEALQIYTMNGARALRLERQTGSIERGKSADIIILDRNLFRVPIEDVSETKVERTYFEGKLVYEAPR
jgi:predicted amidohydrolase YtcJ